MLRTGQPCQSAMPKPSSVTQQAQQEPLLFFLVFFFLRKAHRLTFCDVHVSGKTRRPSATRRTTKSFCLFLFTRDSVLQVCVTHRSSLLSFFGVQVIFRSDLYRTGGKVKERGKASAVSVT